MNIQFLVNLTLGIIGLLMIAYIIPNPKLKYTFLFAYACLVFYRLYDPSTGGPGTDWMRHIVVSVGEIAFFIFITNFCKQYIEREDDSSNIFTNNSLTMQADNQQVSSQDESNVSMKTIPPAPLNTETISNTNIRPPQNFGFIGIPMMSFGGLKVAGVSLLTFGSFTAIYGYGSAQGISHIFLAPVFLAIIAIVFNRISTYSSPYKNVAKLLILAYALGIMLHVGEFFLESHPLITLSKVNQHNMEMFWYVLSSLVFFYALVKFSSMLKRNDVTPKTV